MIRKIAIVFCALLSIAFLVRAGQFGYKWFSGVEETNVNFQALTVWSLVYAVVTAGAAWLVCRLSREEETIEG